ncbi:FAD-binding oxidoreductase [Synechococcus sp. CC9311]|uniref:NAD(P)/FAD-dependent oxidoreductase n=1 Tax=Synechococcus sp. (strain CC9311) TaxID=64471 RepID=UPI0000DDB435|nr:FAD-dependent oxidoreductase [Synechococcus sp. CC9311]ABI47216.1 NAD binding site:D-amino acid oxidase [Synechococcus sp. CC9311]
MIGAGAVGAGTAWHLARQGHNVTLIDPSLDAAIQRSNSRGQALNGTTASLGVLMGNVFRRSSGRAWRLRQRSMELWPQWVERLNHPDTPLELDSPLIQMASSPAEKERMQNLANQRRELGLESFSSANTETHQTFEPIPWPNPGHGGLRSQNDGRIDPLALQRALRRSLKAEKVDLLPARVTTLHRPGHGDGDLWNLELDTGHNIHCDFVVICTALASALLLQPLGHEFPMEAVLGQVLDLQVSVSAKAWDHWPAVLICNGVNLIRHGSNRLWLGATLEPGTEPSAEESSIMQRLDGLAPNWLQQAKVVDQWHGLRARPSGRPAPLLEVLEPGLILASGHYRNGVLLTPATVDWVGQQIMTTTPIEAS